MRSIRRDTQFKRDVKRLKKRNKDFEKLKAIIQLLVEGEKLPPKAKDHRLKGTLKDCRECHIEPDWLLIYRIEGSDLCLVRTGSHADLFEFPGPVVLEAEVAAGVVDHEDVSVAVVIVVGRDHSHSRPRVGVHARLGAHVGEGAVAVIAEEGIGQGAVLPGSRIDGVAFSSPLGVLLVGEVFFFFFLTLDFVDGPNGLIGFFIKLGPPTGILIENGYTFNENLYFVYQPSTLDLGIS